MTEPPQSEPPQSGQTQSGQTQSGQTPSEPTPAGSTPAGSTQSEPTPGEPMLIGRAPVERAPSEPTASDDPSPDDSTPTRDYEISVKPPISTKTVLPVALVLSLLCGCGFSVGGYLLFRKVDEANRPIRNGAVAFLDDLKSEHYTSAYGRLCPSTQERFSRNAFTAAVSGGAGVVAYHIERIQVTNDKGRLTGRVTATVVNAGGSSRERTIAMTSEGGEWKVCGDPY